MTLECRGACTGYPYKKGEIIDFVVDPFWDQHKRARQIQKGIVREFNETHVWLEPVGEPWDDDWRDCGE